MAQPKYLVCTLDCQGSVLLGINDCRFFLDHDAIARQGQELQRVKGTNHGRWNPGDAHIPLLFYGWKVPHGACPAEVHITDIAPTVCLLLHIQQPNACVGEALEFK